MFLKLIPYLLILFLVVSCGSNRLQEGRKGSKDDLIAYQSFVKENETKSFLDDVSYTFQYTESCSDGTLFSGQLTKVFTKNGTSCQFQIVRFSDGTDTYTPSGNQAVIVFDSSGTITHATFALYTGISGSKILSAYHQISPDGITFDLVDGSLTPANGLAEAQQQITFPSSGIVSSPGCLLNACTFTNFTFSTNMISCDSINKKITLRMTNNSNSSDKIDVIFAYTGSFSVTTNSLRYTTIGTSLIVQVSPLDICQTNPSNILATNGWILSQGGGQGINASTAKLVYKPSLNSSDVNSKLTSGATYTTSYTLGTGGTLAVATVNLYTYSFSLPL